MCTLLLRNIEFIIESTKSIPENTGYTENRRNSVISVKKIDFRRAFYVFFDNAYK